MDAGPSRRSEVSSWLPWTSSSDASSSSSTSTLPVRTDTDLAPTSTMMPVDHSSPDPFYEHPPPKRIELEIPSSLLVLTPAAAVVGLFIGMRRGGNKARLRFLAENVHRQPNTVQGWYFYQKTRNYRVIFGALREGGKTAAALGAAGALFAAGEEGAGWLRERVLDPALTHEELRTPPNPRRVGWRKGPVHWEDGAAAGSLMAVLVGLIYRLPNPLMVRSLVMGFALGGVTSGLKIAQDKIAFKKAEEERLNPRDPEEEKGDWNWGWIWRIWK